MIAGWMKESGVRCAGYGVLRRSGTEAVIISTDIGDDIDDTWALSLALKCPELDIKLVIGDYGNATNGRLIAKILEAAKRTDIPVGVRVSKGAKDGALINQVDRGYDLQRYPGKVHQDGVQKLIDIVMTSPEPVTLICVRPLPNIAEALRRRRVSRRKPGFVGMHGSVRRGYGAVPRRAPVEVAGPIRLRAAPCCPRLGILRSPRSIPAA